MEGDKVKEKIEKINYFNREEITRHEKLQRAKELYIDYMEQDHYVLFSKFSPQANRYVMELFEKYKPNQLKAFRKYVGIRKRKKKRVAATNTAKSKVADGSKPINRNPMLHTYAQLGLRFESKVKEVLLVLNQHKNIDFQVVVPVKGHGTNVNHLKPDIVINDDIWIDCKLSINSNLKETALKYEGHCRKLEFYLLMSNDIGYGVDKKSGQIVRSIWNILERAQRKIGPELYQHYIAEFQKLEQEYLDIQGSSQEEVTTS
ncbi:hypothetical protein P4605_10240 [Priestia aryabhattai]|uniref:hypothetical protein n=1 Tax=Priestia aryabhattai TaxID=412384 RepID=UPI002E1A472D|nr:hypothetical protein [Priestia aryabhattai]